jgi:hypothetical protein
MENVPKAANKRLAMTKKKPMNNRRGARWHLGPDLGGGAGLLSGAWEECGGMRSPLKLRQRLASRRGGGTGERKGNSRARDIEANVTWWGEER